MISKIFIERPVFAFVISIFMMLAGLAALRILPIAQYPDITPPVVEVRAFYPGASAEVIEQTVAAPLENAINGVEDMMYMSSTSSSNGALSITITFEIGTDIDQAALNVNNRVKQIEARLPEEVRRQSVIVEKGSSSFLQVVAFYSPNGERDDLFTSNYVTLNVLDQLKRIPGTTNVQIFGAKDYAMRVWLKPDVMARFGVTVYDIGRAIAEQNAQFAAGKIGQPPIDQGQELVYTITSKGRLSSAEEFGQIIIRSNPDGSSLKLRDVARIELGSKDYDFLGCINGKPATLVGIFLQPGANALKVGDHVKEVLHGMSKSFPAGLTYAIPYDTTRFIEVSIHEVMKTLVEAMILVFLVVFVFLQNWRATLIPMLVVPISLIGTLAGMHLLGYSINTLTLFGMVLAIGTVVDDAIVVLENAERIMHEEGLPARQAVEKAMTEVTGPVIAIVLVLCAVFVPIAFLGGLTGELYRQFAITLSISVVLSGIVALTLTPALCAMFLQGGQRKTFRWGQAFNNGLHWVTLKYVDGVRFLMRHAWLGVLLFLVMVAATAWLWKKTPGSLVPDEDQGYYIAAVYLPDGSTLQRTQKIVDRVVEAIRSNAANQDVISFTGMDFLGGGFKNSAATIFVTQKHWKDRKVSSAELVGELFMKTGDIKEALILAFNPPAIFGLGNTGGFEFVIQNRGEGGPQKLSEAMGAFLAKAQQDPRLGMINTLWRPTTPQIRVNMDRERAKALGVNIDEAFNTLAATLGSYYVNDFNKFGRAWQVLVSADADYRRRPEDIGMMYVRGSSGQMIPLSSIVDIEFSSGADTLDRYNNLPAVKLIGQGAPGVSSGQAIAAVEEIAAQVLPQDFSYEWTGASFQEKRSTGNANLSLILALIMVFLILAALYNRWSLPMSVLLALPFGTFGALAAVGLRGFNNDVYFQIGLVTLLGLTAKNAILIVEYALLKKDEHGWPAAAAALDAARLRFRPIMMTSLTFILGVVPLAFSHGAGAGARQAVGTGVMGGMLAATFLAIFFIPLFFQWIVDRRLFVRPEELKSPERDETHA